VSWDEGFAHRYDEWAAHMTSRSTSGSHGRRTGEPFTEDSQEYVFVTRAPVGLGLPDHVMEGINRHG
jgi:hypothetical protein